MGRAREKYLGMKPFGLLSASRGREDRAKKGPVRCKLPTAANESLTRIGKEGRKGARNGRCCGRGNARQVVPGQGRTGLTNAPRRTRFARARARSALGRRGRRRLPARGAGGGGSRHLA